MKDIYKPFSKFLTIWFGQLFSSIGSGMTAFALGIYAFQQTHTVTSYSLIILLAFLPSFVLKPIGGVLADRMDRRLMMMIGDMGAAAGVLFIVIMLFADTTQIWPIYLGVAVSSIFVALQNPAYKAAITDLLDKEVYAKASGLMQLAESSKFLISPILAGVLMSFIKIEYVLIIDILTFIMAVTTVMWIKRSVKIPEISKEKEDFFTDLKNGFKYTVSHKGILWLLIITSLITFAIGFLQALIGPMILGFTDAKSLGIVLSVSATGMLVSSFLIGVFIGKHKQVSILSVSLGLAGIFYALLGVSSNIIFIIFAGFMFFFVLPFVNTSLDVLVRQNVDNNIQGRVWSIVSLISQSGMVIAYCIAGFLADHVFNPLFLPNGLFAQTIGAIIGVGAGRGIGFMFILSGILVSIIAIMISKIKVIRALERSKE